RLLKNSASRPIFPMLAMVTKGQRGDPRRRRRRIDYFVASYSTLQTDSSRWRQNFRDADEIVCGCRKHKKPSHEAASAMSGLAQAAHRLPGGRDCGARWLQRPARKLFESTALYRRW